MIAFILCWINGDMENQKDKDKTKASNNGVDRVSDVPEEDGVGLRGLLFHLGHQVIVGQVFDQ